MIVPAVPDFPTGISSPSLLNQLGDVVAFQLAPPIARLMQTVAQSLTTGAYTPITFDTHTVDTNIAGTPQHDDVTNNSRFTAVYPGWYSPGGGTGFAANSAGRRGNRWQVNGTFINGSLVILSATATGGCYVPTRRELIYLNVGDYLELTAFQDSGGALLTAVGADQSSTMTVYWVSN